MQMMYETIYKALDEVGLEDAFSSQDFLNFFCLGNREAVDESNSSGMPTPSSSPIPQVSSFLKSVVSFMLCILQYLVLWEMRNLLVQNHVLYKYYYPTGVVKIWISHLDTLPLFLYMRWLPMHSMRICSNLMILPLFIFISLSASVWTGSDVGSFVTI